MKRRDRALRRGGSGVVDRPSDVAQRRKTKGWLDLGRPGLRMVRGDMTGRPGSLLLRASSEHSIHFAFLNVPECAMREHGRLPGRPVRKKESVVRQASLGPIYL